MVFNNILDKKSLPFITLSLTNTISNVTGDGTVYTLVYDTVLSGTGYNTSTGVFTAPMTLDYIFLPKIYLSGVLSTHTLVTANVTATSFSTTFILNNLSHYKTPAGLAGFSSYIPVIMNEDDTLTFTVSVSGGTKVVNFYNFSTMEIIGNY